MFQISQNIEIASANIEERRIKALEKMNERKRQLEEELKKLEKVINEDNILSKQ